MLQISSLSASYHDKAVLYNLNLSWSLQKIHAICGPNGSGKSSLMHAIMGHPALSITTGSITYGDKDLLPLTSFERARNGIFLAMQHPPALPGVKVKYFLQQAYHAIHRTLPDPTEWDNLVHDALHMVGLAHAYLERGVHDGFSGGEKKRLELLQCMLLRPSLIMLDEIDSGLDSIGQDMLIACLTRLMQLDPAPTILIISHATTLLTRLPIATQTVLAHGHLHEVV